MLSSALELRQKQHKGKTEVDDNDPSDQQLRSVLILKDLTFAPLLEITSLDFGILEPGDYSPDPCSHHMASRVKVNGHSRCVGFHMPAHIIPSFYRWCQY